jgi:hypothetical protein
MDCVTGATLGPGRSATQTDKLVFWFFPASPAANAADILGRHDLGT